MVGEEPLKTIKRGWDVLTSVHSVWLVSLFFKASLVLTVTIQTSWEFAGEMHTPGSVTFMQVMDVLIPMAWSPICPDFRLKASITSPCRGDGLRLGWALKKPSVPVEASLPQVSFQQYVYLGMTPRPFSMQPSLGTPFPQVPLQGAVALPMFGVRPSICTSAIRWDFQGINQKQKEWLPLQISITHVWFAIRLPYEFSKTDITLLPSGSSKSAFSFPPWLDVKILKVSPEYCTESHT